MVSLNFMCVKYDTAIHPRIRLHFATGLKGVGSNLVGPSRIPERQRDREIETDRQTDRDRET